MHILLIITSHINPRYPVIEKNADAGNVTGSKVMLTFRSHACTLTYSIVDVHYDLKVAYISWVSQCKLTLLWIFVLIEQV